MRRVGVRQPPHHPEGIVRFVAPFVRPVAPPPHPRNRAALRLETLEARENPAIVTWLPTTGGVWTDPLNWSTGVLPGAADIAVINLPATETVTIPNTGTGEIEVQAVRSTGSLEVGSTLRATYKSSVSGELNVTETGTLILGLFVAPPPPGGGGSPPPGGGPGASYPPDMVGPFPTDPDLMDPLNGGLIASGGGTIAGTVINNGEMYLSAGTFHLTGTGTLGFTGWYGVQGELSLEGADATIHNFSVISGGVVDGNANLTVSDTFISAGGTFTGANASTVTVGKLGYILPQLSGTVGATFKSRGLLIPENKTEKIAADIVMKDLAVIENRGTVEVTGNQRITRGVGGGRVDNFGSWNLLSGYEAVEVPFVNTKTVTADATTLQGQQLVFFDYTQSDGSDAALSFSGSTVWVAKADIRSGSLLGGDASGIGFFNVDSTLDGSGTSQLSFSQSKVIVSGTDLTADQNSTVRFAADAVDDWAVAIDNSIFALNGLSVWTQGNIGTVGLGSTYGRILNSGRFRVESSGKRLGVMDFDNSGRFEQVVGEAQNPTQVTATFVNSGQGANNNGVYVTSGAIRFEGGDNEFSGTTITNDVTAVFFCNDPMTNGTTTMTAGATFLGQGMVSIVGDAVWKVPAGVLVPVDNLTLTITTDPDIIRPGGGSIYGITDPQHPGSLGGTVWVQQSVKLDSFQLENSRLVIDPGATGKMTPGDGATANLLTADIDVKGSLEWTGTAEVIADNSKITVGGPDSVSAQFVINTNANMLRLRGPDGTASKIWIRPNGSLVRGNAGGTNKLDVDISNTGGTADVSGLTVTGRLSQTAGTTTLAGRPATFNGGVLIDGGTLDLAGGTLTGDVTVGWNVDVNNQRTDGTLTGAGTIDGKLSNSGTIEVGGKGTAGVLNVTGNFSNTGTVVIELGAAQAGASDQLRVRGTASLGGTLSIKALAGFDPAGNNTYTIMTYGTRSGNFATVTGLNIRDPLLTTDPQDTQYDLK